MGELKRETEGDCTNFLRMEPAMFHELLQRLTSRLIKEDTTWCKALESALKLAITLLFLATGDSYHSLAYSFRVPHNMISCFLGEVCKTTIAE